MRVKTLIKKLERLDQNALVMLGFDSGIRMDVEAIGITTEEAEDTPAGTVVLTDKYEFSFVKKWHKMRRVK